MRMVRALPTLMDAINLSITMSGKPDKSLYMDLDIDQGQWSRIRSGALKNFPISKLTGLMRATGNHIPLLWLVDVMGYDAEALRPTEAELRRQLAEANKALADLRAERRGERQMLADMLGGRAA